jgi:DNA-directed RNA polymerase subunit F
MSVNNKHLATFILGAAAGIALHKYAKTDEGKELVDQIKSKGNELRDDAESSISKAPEYFESLKTEASSSMNELLAKIKEKFPEAENVIADLFNKKTEDITINEDTKTS